MFKVKNTEQNTLFLRVPCLCAQKPKFRLFLHLDVTVQTYVMILSSSLCSGPDGECPLIATSICFAALRGTVVDLVWPAPTPPTGNVSTKVNPWYLIRICFLFFSTSGQTTAVYQCYRDNDIKDPKWNRQGKPGVKGKSTLTTGELAELACNGTFLPTF